MDAIQKRVAEGYLEAMANRDYQKAIAEWEQRIRVEEARNYERLQDPQFAISLGLPAQLPSFTINILKKTLAIDSIGPDKPEVSKSYRRYGF